MQNDFITLKELFIEDNSQLNELIQKIYRMTKSHQNFNKMLSDKLSVNYNHLFEIGTRKPYKVREDIFPLDIIGSTTDSRFCNIEISEFLKRNEFNKFFLKNNQYNTNYFFENICDIDKKEPIICISFNNDKGKKFYFISHGHHRCIIGMFLQMIDPTYKLKGVLVEPYTLNWEDK